MKRWGIVLGLVLGSVLASVSAHAADALYPEFQLSAPAHVGPGAAITVTGTLVRSDGLPYKKVEVQTSVRCADPSGSITGLPNALTDNQGAFEFGTTAGGCNLYWFRAYYLDSGTGYYADTTAEVVVDRTKTSLAVDAQTTAFTTDDVPVTATLTGPGGAPIVGATVHLARRLGGVAQTSWTLTTDDQGKVATIDSIPDPGAYDYRASFEGTIDDDYSSALSGGLNVSRRPTSITLNGPSDVVIDVPFTVSGTLTGPSLPAQVTVNGPGGFTTTVETDASGAYEASVVSSIGGSNYVTAVFAQTPAYDQAAKSIQVTAPKLLTSVDLQQVVPVQTNQGAILNGHVSGVDGPVDVVVAPTGYPGMGVTVTTDADGSFSKTLYHPWVVPFVGTDNWTVSFAGNARYAASSASADATYLPLPTTLKIQPHAPVPCGQAFALNGTLVGPPAGSVVTIRSGGQTWRAFTTETGAFSAWVSAGRTAGTAKYQVSFTPPEESIFGPASATAYIGQRTIPHIRTVPQHPRSTSGRVFFYNVSDDPLLVTFQNPKYRGACHRYVVQRLSHGSWVDVRRSICRPLDFASGSSRWRWRATPRAGVTYRVFAEIDAHGMYWSYRSDPRLIRFR